MSDKLRGGTTIGGNIAWHAGNDGSGSGLDADLLDGQQGSYYYPASNPNGYTSSVNTTTDITTTHNASTVAVNSSDGTNGTINAATTSLAGVMSYTDKTKLNGIAAGAQVNVATNLSATAGTTAGPTINSSTGDNVVIPSASATASGIITTGTQTIAGAKTFAGNVLVEGMFTTSEIRTPYSLDDSNDVVHISNFGAGKVIWAQGKTELTNSTSNETTLNVAKAGVGTGYALNVSAGNAYFAGSIYAVGDITAFSDENLKTNIEKIPNAVDKIQKINGYTFDRIDIETQRQSGVIAQEIQAVLPEVVTSDDTGTLSVAYGNMAGLFIEAIKEQQKTIEDLTKRIETLEGK